MTDSRIIPAMDMLDDRRLSRSLRIKCFTACRREVIAEDAALVSRRGPCWVMLDGGRPSYAILG
jgi:hypothetical protein